MSTVNAFIKWLLPIEMRYKGKKLNAMLGDICWWLKNMHNEDNEDSEDSDNESDGNASRASSDSDSDRQL